MCSACGCETFRMIPIMYVFPKSHD